MSKFAIHYTTDNGEDKKAIVEAVNPKEAEQKFRKLLTNPISRIRKVKRFKG